MYPNTLPVPGNISLVRALGIYHQEETSVRLKSAALNAIDSLLGPGLVDTFQCYYTDHHKGGIEALSMMTFSVTDYAVGTFTRFFAEELKEFIDAQPQDKDDAEVAMQCVLQFYKQHSEAMSMHFEMLKTFPDIMDVNLMYPPLGNVELSRVGLPRKLNFGPDTVAFQALVYSVVEVIEARKQGGQKAADELMGDYVEKEKQREKMLRAIMGNSTVKLMEDGANPILIADALFEQEKLEDIEEPLKEEPIEVLGIKRHMFPNAAPTFITHGTDAGGGGPFHFGNMKWTPGCSSFSYNLTTRKARKKLENELIWNHPDVSRVDIRGVVKWLIQDQGAVFETGLDLAKRDDFDVYYECYKEDLEESKLYRTLARAIPEEEKHWYVDIDVAQSYPKAN